MYSAARTALLFAMSLSAAATAAAQSVIYVDDTATGAADGDSWTNAFTDLQSALDAAAASAGPDEIRVAAGTYRPDTGGLADPRTASFSMPADTQILGGFAGASGLDPDARDPDATPSFLSGDIGVANDAADNCYHVVRALSVGASGVLDGFRIRHGNADAASFSDNAGAGILISGSAAPIIRNCRFRFNTSTNGGGAARVIDSSATFENCEFLDNSSTSGGGAYVNSIVVPNLTTFRGCRFERNAATASNGGGLYGSAADCRVADCLFLDNVASFSGGGVSLTAGSPVIANSTFLGNDAGTNAGGGLYGSGVNLTLVNSVFSGNTAAIIGGGAALQISSDADVVNCTFANNTAVVQGGGLFSSTSTLSLANSILYFNSVGADMDEDAQIQLTTVTQTLNRNNIQGLTGGLGGTGDFDADPLFTDADGADNVAGTADDDLAPQAGSPCIDAGDNAAVPADAADVDGDADAGEPTPRDLRGHPRFQDVDTVIDTGSGAAPIVDLGAMERDADCNANGMADFSEIAADATLDCNTNGVPDACEMDTDGDSVPDVCDLCGGDDASGDSDGDGLCDDVDACPLDADNDADGDGVCGDADACPNDPAKSADAGICGCGAPDADLDSDRDNAPDCVDGCPLDAGKTDAGACGCGNAETDSDGDGTPDCVDACATDAAKTDPGACGCGNADADDDANGIPDCLIVLAIAPPDETAPAGQFNGGCGVCGIGGAFATMSSLLGLAAMRRRGW